MRTSFRRPSGRLLASFAAISLLFGASPAFATIGTCDLAQPVEVEATAGTPGPTGYTTVKLAFDAINAGTHQGAINIEVCASTTEGTTPATLNSSGAGPASYTSISLRPLNDGLTVSGNPVTGFGVIQLKGADNVTIDGDNPNTAGTNRNLTIANTTTTTVIANSVIRIATAATVVTSADNITIRNLVLNGNVTNGNASAITSASGSSNSSFCIYAGGNGGATATDSPTAITSVTTQTAPTGTTINNLSIDNNAINQCARGIVFNGASAGVSTGVTVSNNTVGAAGTPTPAVPPYTSPATTVYTKGIWLNGTSAVTVTGNTVQNVMSYVATTVSGIELAGAIGASVTISNNNVSNTTNNGPAANIAKGVLISSATGSINLTQNIVSNTQALGGAQGTAGMDIGGSATSGIVQQNRVATVYNRSTGTFGAWGVSVAAGTGIALRNNFVSDVNMDMTGGAAFSTTFGVHGIRIAGGTGHSVQNNTVSLFGTMFGTATTSLLSSALTIVGTGQTGMDVRNNVLSNTLAGGTTSIAHVSLFLPSGGTSAMNLNLNNNDYFSGTDAARQGIAQVGTTAGTGFFLAPNFNPAATTPASNLRSYTDTLRGTTGNDNASAIFDPSLVSTTDLHLSPGSLAQNAGATIAAVTNDIDQQLRPGGGSYDIGADEIDGITPPANDASATAFIDPLSGGIKLVNSAFSPQASFTNNGTSTQTSLQVRYRIVDAALVEVYNQTAVIPSLAFNASTTVTFPPATLVAAGTYSIFARAEALVDTVPGNDQIVGTLTAATPLSGTVTVGPGGNYTSLTNPDGLFSAINNLGVTGNVTANVIGDSTAETGAVALNPLAGGFTLLVQSSAATERLISGSGATGLIRLNGADNVTFDGRVGGTGRFLRFRNTNTGGSTFSFVNDSTLNTVTNVFIEGASTSAATGTVVFGTTTGSAGNSGNTIRDSEIRDRSDAAGVPTNGVFSSGSAGGPNGTNGIINNNIFNYTGSGVLLAAAGAGDAWGVTGNNFFQTAPRTTTLAGITLLGGNAHVVTSNNIGGSAPGATGAFTSTSAQFRGIDLSVGTVTATSVQGNVVKNVRNTTTSFTASYGIFVQLGRVNVGNVLGNQVGSSDPNERMELNGDSYGIRTTSTSVVNISNNTINNLTTAPNVPAGEFYWGMSVEGAAGSHTVVNNTITNISNGAIPDVPGNFNSQTIGLQVSATGAQTVRGNVISNIANTSTPAPTGLNNRVWGVILSATGAGTVFDSNRVSGVTGSSAGAGARADVITGVQLQSLANATLTNNMVALDGGAPSDRPIFAVLDLNAAGATANYYFNSVLVSGSGATANSSFAFNRNGVGTVSLRDNIFANTRTGGTGFHVAMANSNAAATGWSATASNYNIVFNTVPTNVTQWLGSAPANNQTLAGFQAASGGDANSINADPLFLGATDLHIAPGSPASNAGIPFGGVTVDIDQQLRSATTPDIGADEIGIAPTIAAVPVSTRAGDSAATTTIANANDAEDAENTLAVTVNAAASATVNGVSVGSISTSAAGVVSASVGASCSASDASFTLRVTDSDGLFSESTLNVTVLPNLAPSLAYPASTNAVFGQSLTVNPTSGPTDSGTIASVVVQDPGSYTGGASVDASAVVSLTGAAPVGTHTIVIRATDNCGLPGDANLSLTVAKANTTTAITSNTPNPSTAGQPVVVNYTVTPVAPGAGTPTGNVTVGDGVDSCTGTVAAGTCTVALTTSGTRTLTATYAGDAGFNGSTSAGVPQLVDVPNTAPTISAVGVTRRAGDASANSTIATVSDPEDAETAIVVTVNGSASATVNGVTVSGIATNAAGTTTANVVAACGATTAAFTLRATDTGGLFNTATLNVTVNPNLAPTLTYPATTNAVFGQNLTVNPATGPSDSGTVNTIAVQSNGTYTGTSAVNNGTGVVTLTGAQPVGTHTIVIRATDNCAATTDANLQLVVGQAATTTTITSDLPDPSNAGQNVVVQYTVTANAPGAGTPAGNVTVSDGVNNCTGTVAAGQCTVAFVTPGPRTITATYAGNTSFAGSSDTEAHVVNAATDLSITKTANTSQAATGLIQYTVVATNAGPLPVTGATVIDNVPVIVTGVTWTCAGTGSGTCTGSGSGNINQTVNLPVNATVTFSITGTIPTEPLPGTIVNTATVNAPAGITDTNTANNSATVTTVLTIFRNGFEDGPGNAPLISLEAPAANQQFTRPVPIGDLFAAARDATPSDVALFKIGDSLVVVSARRLGDATQASVLVRDATGWHAGPWVSVLPQQLVSLVWSRDGAGQLKVGLEVN